MAGQPGRSGGARPGAGRKKKPVAETPPGPPPAESPLAFLVSVMNDEMQDPKLRVRAAVAAAQYVHTKRADGGKKEEKNDAAKAAGKGKFGASAPPLQLVARK